MRKILLSVLTSIIVACSLFMTACSVVGTYKFEKMYGGNNGVSIEIVQGQEFYGQTITKDFVTLVLNEDGTGQLNGMGITGQITWVEEFGVIKVTADGETVDFIKSGNTLTFTIEGITIVLKKQ